MPQLEMAFGARNIRTSRILIALSRSEAEIESFANPHVSHQRPIFPTFIRNVKDMTDFSTIRTYAIWISLSSGVAAYFSNVLAFDVVNDLRMTAVFTVAWACSTLIAMASAPFALIDLWKICRLQLPQTGLPATRVIAMLRERINGRAILRDIQTSAASVGSFVWRQISCLATATRATARDIPRHLAKIAASMRALQALRIAANIVVTLLPFIVVALAFFLHKGLAPRRWDLSGAFMLGLGYAQPVIFIAGVALKSRLDMPRIFTLSPGFLFGFGKFLLISGPVLAGVSAFFIIVGMSSPEGWEYLLAPLVAIATVIHFVIMGCVVMLIGAIMRRSHRNRPPPPPKPDPRWMDDPIWTEIPPA